MIELRCSACGFIPVSVQRPMSASFVRSEFTCKCGERWGFDIYLAPLVPGGEQWRIESAHINAGLQEQLGKPTYGFEVMPPSNGSGST